MSIEKTIETVRSHEGEISISEICDLADAYEALAAENAELREAVESALRSLDAANDPERAIEWLEAVLEKYK